ncbi:MAG: TonB-dependent receptor [Flavobacterium sp. BFFFF2]|nr:MAG: TonB-dependent receptor [Flavobacterium sp. BFFFF2]
MNRFIFSLAPIKIKTLAFSLLLLGTAVQAQQTPDSLATQQLDDVLVSALRVKSKTPVSFSNVSKAELAPRNLGQDIPVLLQYLPSVVTTSDAGTGIGYTGLRVRGSDATRVNVTINGVPYNDAESQGVYWVNMPDFASSVQNLQLQRGVGSSTNGSGAFGASLNVLTDTQSAPMTEISNSAGSFNTHKHTLKFSTGLLPSGIELAGRLSSINSQGYVDRAFSNLKSYFLQATYVGKTSQIKALAFGGKEQTYQAWYGVDGATMGQTRTYNFAGIYTDANGNTQFYDNQTDNYFQNHYQLHWSESWSKRWKSHVGVHYTKGKGFYEEYQAADVLANYGIADVNLGAGNTITQSDLIRQKWLDNDFYGAIYSAQYHDNQNDLTIGGGHNVYEGAHYGKVKWVQAAATFDSNGHYYDFFGRKTDTNLYAKYNRTLSNGLQLYADLQLRKVHYLTDGVFTGTADDSFLFFNPKAGLSYLLTSKSLLYASYAHANREPNRTDYENGTAKPEMMDDYELGWRYETAKTRLNVNGYFMYYRNQLILTGALDNVGNPIRANSDRSYRLGLEVELTTKISNKWTLRPNFTLSRNVILDSAPQGGLEANQITQIAYSPSVIAANAVTYAPIKSLQISWMVKHVGAQYLDNFETEAAKLADYTTNDVNIRYEWNPKKWVKSVVVTGLLNNIFDKKYSSNGYMYGTAYYYPQAGINGFVGLTLLF